MFFGLRTGQIPRSGRDFEPLPCSWPMLGFSTMEKLSFTSPKEVGTNRPHLNMGGPNSNRASPGQRVRNFGRAWRAIENLENCRAQKNRFPRQTFNSKNSFFGRWRPRALLTAREHRRVRCGNGERVRVFHTEDAKGSKKRAKIFDAKRTKGSKKHTGPRPPQEKGLYFRFGCKKLLKHDK